MKRNSREANLKTPRAQEHIGFLLFPERVRLDYQHHDNQAICHLTEMLNTVDKNQTGKVNESKQ